MKARKIPTKDGLLEVEMTTEFIARLRAHYSLNVDQEPNDDQVKSYLVEAVRSAVEKAELAHGA